MKTPSTWHAEYQSPLGAILLAAGPAGLCGVYFEGQRWFPRDIKTWRREDRSFGPAKRWLNDYFSGRSSPYVDPLEFRGTPFQKAVWQALREIPPGATCSYQEVAATIGRPSASRAVGAAIGRNPLSVIVPCHRVIGGRGGLTGYAGGLSRKEYLLRLEGAWKG